MFRSVVLACLLAVAAAFAPTARTSSRSSSLSMMAERSKSLPFLMRPAKLDGSMAGDEGFDPLGLSNINDIGVDLYWMREAELKHSRVAMLAVVGAIAGELGFVFPGLPTGKNQVELFWSVVEQNPGPLFAGVIFLGIVELISGYAITAGRKSGDRAPGDFGFKSMGKNAASVKDYELKEIRNGRLAMWAAAGILLQGATNQYGALEAWSAM